MNSSEQLAELRATDEATRELAGDRPALSVLEALVQLRSWCIPGMNWTDDTGQALLDAADAAIAAERHDKRYSTAEFREHDERMRMEASKLGLHMGIEMVNRAFEPHKQDLPTTVKAWRDWAYREATGREWGRE